MKQKTSNTNVATATKSVKPNRDLNGRFAPKVQETARTVVRDTKSGRYAPTKVRDLTIGEPITVSDSSFISKIVFNPDNTVGVVMSRDPKTVYAYKPTAKGLKSVMSAVRNNASVGAAFNKHLKDREQYRVIFKKSNSL